MTSHSQLNQLDPSTPQPGENDTTWGEAEFEVTFAYGVAQKELDVLLKMVGEAATPPKDDDVEGLKRYRDTIAHDVRRIGLRVQLSKKYLKAHDAKFHYHAKRLRTEDRVDRLRLWQREKLRELEGVRLQSGDAGFERASAALDERKRVLIRCYNLQKYWDRALKREMRSQLEGDDLSSGCETE